MFQVSSNSHTERCKMLTNIYYVIVAVVLAITIALLPQALRLCMQALRALRRCMTKDGWSMVLSWLSRHLMPVVSRGPVSYCSVRMQCRWLRRCMTFGVVCVCPALYFAPTLFTTVADGNIPDDATLLGLDFELSPLSELLDNAVQRLKLNDAWWRPAFIPLSTSPFAAPTVPPLRVYVYPNPNLSTISPSAADKPAPLLFANGSAVAPYAFAMRDHSRVAVFYTSARRIVQSKPEEADLLLYFITPHRPPYVQYTAEDRARMKDFGPDRQPLPRSQPHSHVVSPNPSHVPPYLPIPARPNLVPIPPSPSLTAGMITSRRRRVSSL